MPIILPTKGLTKEVDGYVMTSVLNTYEREMEVQEPVADLDEVESIWEKG